MILLLSAIFLSQIIPFTEAQDLTIPEDDLNDKVCSNFDSSYTPPRCGCCGFSTLGSDLFLLKKIESGKAICNWVMNNQVYCGLIQGTSTDLQIRVAVVTNNMLCDTLKLVDATGIYFKGACPSSPLLYNFKLHSNGQIADLAYFQDPSGSIPRCQIDCLTETYKRYKKKDGANYICEAASSNCVVSHVRSDSSVICMECDYTINKFGDLATCSNYKDAIKPTGTFLNCDPASARSNSNLDAKFYLAPKNTGATNCYILGTCSGSFADPFDDFVQILNELECTGTFNIGTRLDAKITIFLMFQDDLPHYFLDKLLDDSNQIVFSVMDADSGSLSGVYINRWIYRAFYNSKVELNIRPVFKDTDDCLDATKCYDVDQKATIIWKSSLLNFWVQHRVSIQNIVIDFSDMYPFRKDNPSSVNSFIYKKQRGCVCGQDGVCKRLVESTDPECNPDMMHPYFSKSRKDYSKIIPNTDLSASFVDFKAPHAIFNMYPIQLASGTPPLLEIISCEIKNFNYHPLSNSLVSISKKYGSNLVIQNSVMFNNLFLNGAITNSPESYLRNNPFKVPEFDSACSASLPQSSSCYSISLTDTTFTLSNHKSLLRYPADNCDSSKCEIDLFHEGIVLFLVRFAGPINIERCTFSYLRPSIIFGSKNDCLFSKTKDQKLKASAQPKVHLDKLIYSYLESGSGGKKEIGTSSVIQIRYLENRLIMKENTFEDNVGLTGTGLFLFYFKYKTFQNDPLVILSNNIFQRNSALQFGHSIVMFHNEIDYYTLLAKNINQGILLNENTFSQNAGCQKSYGNVIIAISPFKAEKFLTTKTNVNTDGELFGYNFIYGEYKTATPNVKQQSDLFSDTITKIQAAFEDAYNPTEEYLQEELSCTFRDNTFEYNLAAISNAIFIQGCSKVLFKRNRIAHNSVPLEEYLNQGIYKELGYSKLIKSFIFNPSDSTNGPYPSGTIYTADEKNLTTMASPVIFHLSVIVYLYDCTFENNTQLYDNDLYLGSAITYESMIGGVYYILNSRFLNHKGIDPKFKLSTNPNFKNVYRLKSKTETPLISFSYRQSNSQTASYTTKNDYLKYSAEVFVKDINTYLGVLKTFTSKILIASVTFQNNEFHLEPALYSSARNYSYPDVALIRFYEDEESNPFFQNKLFLGKFMKAQCQYSIIMSFQLQITETVISKNLVTDKKSLLFPRYNTDFMMSEVTFEENTLNSTAVNDASLINMNYNSSQGYNYLDFNIQLKNLRFFNNKGGAAVDLKNNLLFTFTKPNTIGKFSMHNININNHVCPKAVLMIQNIPKAEIYEIIARNVENRDGVIYFQDLNYKSSETEPLSFRNFNFILVNTSRCGCLCLSGVKNIIFENIACSNVTLKPMASLVSPANVSFGGCLVDILGEFNSFKNFDCNFVFFALPENYKMPNEIIGLRKGACLFFTSKQPDIDGLTCLNANQSVLMSTNDKTYAVVIKDTDISMVSAVFQSNYLYGIVVIMTSSGSSIVYCDFSYNQGRGDSSAISLEVQSFLLISDCSFESNKCLDCSGVFKISDMSSLNITSSNITLNFGKDGACISGRVARIFISDCLIMMNRSPNGISGINLLFSEAFIEKTEFKSNEGSKCLFYSSESKIKLVNSIFDSNVADLKSSNFYISDCELINITNCVFQNSNLKKQTLTTLIKGDFINSYESKVYLLYCTFINGFANSGGAVFHMSTTNVLIILHSTFINNTAMISGGGLYLLGNVKLFDCQFQNNTALTSGSTIYSSDGNLLELDFVKISIMAGSAIYLSTNTILRFIKGSLIGTDQFRRLTNVLYNLRAGIICYNCKSIILSNIMVSTFNYTTGASFAIFNTLSSLDGRTVVRIERCTFLGNIGYQGAALYSTGLVSIGVNDSSFINNSAINAEAILNFGRGGAIFFTSDSTNSIFNISDNCKFINNTATLSGGALHYTNRSFSINFSAVAFSDNKAPYGPDKSAYAVKLELIEDPPESLYAKYIEEVNLGLVRLLQSPSTVLPGEKKVSGGLIDPPPVVKIMDEFGQIMYDDSLSVLEVKAGVNAKGSDVTFGFATKFFAYNGYYILYPFSVLNVPGTSVNLEFRSNAIDYTNPLRPDLNKDKMYLTINLRLCVRGEKKSASFACELCPSGTYSIKDFTDSGDKAVCNKCPDGGVCLGGDYFGPDAGYWKLGKSNDAVIQCLNDVACLGAINDQEDKSCEVNYNNEFCITGWCLVGYTGNLCADCQEDYAVDNESTKTCTICINNSFYYIKAILYFSFGAIMVILTIKNSLKSPEKSGQENEVTKSQFQKPEEENKMNKIEVEDETQALKRQTQGEKVNSGEEGEETEEEEEDISPVYIKILMNYIQILSILGTLPFSWPEELKSMFNVNTEALSSLQKFFSFDCLLKQGFVKTMNLRLYFTKLLLFSLSPIIFTIGVYVFWLLNFYIKYGNRIKSMKNLFFSYFYTSIIILLFMVHPNIVQYSFSAFSCKNLGNETKGEEKWFLVQDPQVECWVENHKSMLFKIVVPAIIFWVCGIPLAAILILRKNKSTLDTMETRAKLGFLYEGYHTEFYYWELIILYRKLSIIACAVFMGELGVQIRAIFVLGVSATSYIGQKFMQPYSDDSLNEMEIRSLIASTITLYSSLYFTSASLNRATKLLLFSLIILLNTYFIYLWIKEMLRQKSQTLLKIKILEKCFGRLLRKFAKLKKFKYKPELETEQDQEYIYVDPNDSSLIRKSSNKILIKPGSNRESKNNEILVQNIENVQDLANKENLDAEHAIDELFNEQDGFIEKKLKKISLYEIPNTPNYLSSTLVDTTNPRQKGADVTEGKFETVSGDQEQFLLMEVERIDNKEQNPNEPIVKTEKLSNLEDGGEEKIIKAPEDSLKQMDTDPKSKENKDIVMESID